MNKAPFASGTILNLERCCDHPDVDKRESRLQPRGHGENISIRQEHRPEIVLPFGRCEEANAEVRRQVFEAGSGEADFQIRVIRVLCTVCCHSLLGISAEDPPRHPVQSRQQFLVSPWPELPEPKGTDATTT